MLGEYGLSMWRIMCLACMSLAYAFVILQPYFNNAVCSILQYYGATSVYFSNDVVCMSG